MKKPMMTTKELAEAGMTRIVMPGDFEKCYKCGGAGWVTGKELDDPDEDTIRDSLTRYTCDRCNGDG